MSAPAANAELARLLAPELLPLWRPALADLVTQEVRRQLRAVRRGDSVRMNRRERATRTALLPVLLTVAEASAKAGLDPLTAYNRISQGTLPVVRIQRPGAERGSVRVPSHWAPLWQELGSRAERSSTVAADVAIPPSRLSVEQAASVLSLSPQAGYRLVADGVLMTGEDGRVDSAWLEGWLLETIRDAEEAYAAAGRRGRA